MGGGRLEVYAGNVPVPLLEYSSSLGPKFSEVARGLQQAIKGSPLVVSDDLPRLRCPRCSRLLPEKNATCSNCVRKSAILLRLMSYMRPVLAPSLLLAGATAGRTVAQLAPPYFQKLMIDGVLTPPVPGGPPQAELRRLRLAGAVRAGDGAAAGLATTVLMIAGAWLAAIVGTRITTDIRGQLVPLPGAPLPHLPQQARAGRR